MPPTAEFNFDGWRPSLKPTFKECDDEGTKKMRRMFKDRHILFHLLTLTGDNK